MSIEANDYASICEKDEINLLDVQPGSGSQSICCTLKYVKIFGSVKMKPSPPSGRRNKLQDININEKIIFFESSVVLHTNVAGRGQSHDSCGSTP